MTWKEFVDEVNRTLESKSFDPYGPNININWIDIGYNSPGDLDIRILPYDFAKGGELEITTVI